MDPGHQGILCRLKVAMGLLQYAGWFLGFPFSEEDILVAG